MPPVFDCLQYLIACSMQTRRGKAWGFLSHDPCHMLPRLYVHATNLVICASYKDKRTCMMSGRQRVDMRGAVPNRCNTQTLHLRSTEQRAVLTLPFKRCCLESLDKIFQSGSRDSLVGTVYLFTSHYRDKISQAFPPHFCIPQVI